MPVRGLDLAPVNCRRILVKRILERERAVAGASEGGGLPALPGRP